MKQPKIFPHWKACMLTLWSAAMAITAAAQEYTLKSPDGKTEVRVTINDGIRYQLSHNGQVLVQPSAIGIGTTFTGAGKWKVAGTKTTTVQQILQPVVRQKNRYISDHYTQLQVNFRNNVSLQWRAYNNGVAWRWLLHNKGSYRVLQEQASFAMQPSDSAWYPVETGFYSHNERLYKHLPIDSLRDANSLASLPALFSVKGVKVLVTEADLLNYAGMWLKSDGSGTLQATWPHYPAQKKISSDRDEQVTAREDYIAALQGPASLPWRLLMIADEDRELLGNQLVYQLATPSTGDYSWVKPGKASWDWWNANNIYKVDFRAGINTATYKYYIDFAAHYGLEYVILDEGWSDTRDLLKTAPEIDMEELSRYAASKKVGLVLWTTWLALDKQLDAALDKFAQWGIKGIKVDFMQRDDQEMVQYYERVAKAAAARKMLVDFHGAYKPTGIYRTYPNVISFEGVYGMENSKWDATRSSGPDHAVTFPFIRMAAGPADYTPGAMRNSIRKEWAPVWSNPQSMGTRCQQLAMYVVFESPLQMLADNPTQYYAEPECMRFLQHVPSVWDSTVALQARTGEYILVARKAANGDWYVGGMTNWDARTLTLDLSFLEAGSYRMEVWKDGVNADRNAQDYKVESSTVTKDTRVPVQMAPGGGWAARLVKE